MKKRVEFIESYIKDGNSDYQWCDNHGELIRCKDCKYGSEDTNGRGEPMMKCDLFLPEWLRERDWFCADGERKIEA